MTADFKRPKRVRPTKRSAGSWSSHVVGTHNQRGVRRRSVRSASEVSRTGRAVDRRTAEINQMKPQATPVKATSRKGHNETLAKGFARQQRLIRLGALIAAAVIILLCAFLVGSCAFRNVLSSDMALNDDTATSALAKPGEDGVRYILFVGTTSNKVATGSVPATTAYNIAGAQGTQSVAFGDASNSQASSSAAAMPQSSSSDNSSDQSTGNKDGSSTATAGTAAQGGSSENDSSDADASKDQSSADANESQNENQKENYIAFISVVRVAGEGDRMNMVTIPATIPWSNPEGQGAMMADMLMYGDLAGVIKQVNSIIEADITDVVCLDTEGVGNIINALGGIEVEVAQRVDDPRVSTVVVDPGVQQLDAAQVEALIAASNYDDSAAVRSEHQGVAFVGAANKLASIGGFEQSSAFDAVAKNIKTNLSYDDLEKLKGLYSSANPFEWMSMPGSTYLLHDSLFFSVGATWATECAQFKGGEEVTTTIDTSGVDKSKTSIVVLNGTVTDGLAAQAKGILEANGWKVKETGNADAAVFTETLVVYRNKDGAAQAQAVIDTLGQGRAVYQSVYYNLKTDVQVFIGSDWVTHADVPPADEGSQSSGEAQAAE